jgi:LysR family nitrogen assimilation transcriptional regulator
MDVAAAYTQAAASTSVLRLNGTPLELRDLRCFLRVARTGNFVRAAQELRVSSSTVAYQVQKIESGFGAQLLVRNGRGLTLTRAGICLRDRIDQALRLLVSPLEQDAAFEAKPDIVALAIPAELASRLVTPLVEQFRVRCPAVRLDIQQGNGAALEEWLLNRRVDVAIIQNTSAIPGLETHPVLRETFGLITSVRSPLGRETGPLKLRHLAEIPLILPDQQHWIRRRLDLAAFKVGLRLDPMLLTDSVSLTKTMVRNDLGCTVLPSTAVQEELVQGVLAFRPLVRPCLSVQHAIAHRPAPSTAILHLMRMVRTTMTALADGGVWPNAHVIRQSTAVLFPSSPRAAPCSMQEVA